jgi:hypothetical protein
MQHTRGHPEGKRPFGRFRRRWKDNINMDIEGTEYYYMDCIHLVQDKPSGRLL